ncbi:hypothetical protein D5086_009903 [Populus alba]|uniref:Uncharacterized protein n=2 Tax=Populus alba TaxID=43335 RepID=A0ACC4C7U2_POPAL|nr:uncharacterized protein D5086_0000120830 [Populus alba]
MTVMMDDGKPSALSFHLSRFKHPISPPSPLKFKFISNDTKLILSPSPSLCTHQPFLSFENKPGSKSIYLTRHHYKKIKLYWDFTRAEFTHNSAEPESRFYIAISCNARLEFLLGDLCPELTRRSGLVIARQLGEPALLSRREHVFGLRSYVSRANFLGPSMKLK